MDSSRDGTGRAASRGPVGGRARLDGGEEPGVGRRAWWGRGRAIREPPRARAGGQRTNARETRYCSSTVETTTREAEGGGAVVVPWEWERHAHTLMGSMAIRWWLG
uniref:Uncharacterized protein n=1 Tax=Oryza sativa subsp. japonica TaxID=39947 RepID=Q6K952_ORYSJ|nr:hypothetical protein [Oryza sativa Japonica Group]BAD21597.1 hypothetical protein [Oryza sativa Japonica Group]